MSAADNTSNFSNSSTDVYEDELLAWLQYPVDDAFERNYCSDAFGEVLPLSPKVGAATTHPNAHSWASYSSEMELNTCTGSGSSRLVPIKANVGSPKSFLRPSSNAENALAMAAARAAGRTSPVGHDAFIKVKTSMQPQAITTTVGASLKAFDHKDRSVLDTVKLPVPNASKQAQSRVESSHLHTANSSASMGMSKNASSGYISLVTEQSGKVPSKLTHTQQSRRHRVEEESDGRVNGKHVVRCTSAKANEATATSSSFFSAREKAGRSDQTSEILSSYSGGRSQTSMSLTFMEASNSGKRSYEVSELQSEDADDSMRDVKMPCKSSSRRNRVSHVHNLSERNRRNRINEKLKALQDLIPNSSKIDKASVLDEAIEYMKTLQQQLQMVLMRSCMDMNMTSMMVPMAFPSTPMHMAPFQSIGLGVPVGPIGLAIGSRVGVNAQVQLLPQSGGAAPFQLAPSAMVPCGMLLEYGNRAPLHDSSKALMNPGFLPAHLPASRQITLEPSECVHPRSLSSNYADQSEQQEQEQQLGYSFLDNENAQQVLD